MIKERVKGCCYLGVTLDYRVACYFFLFVCTWLSSQHLVPFFSFSLFFLIDVYRAPSSLWKES